MAATRIIPLHIGKGKTIAKALSDRLDYSQNPDKTDDRKYVSSYECDPETAAEEFALSKKEYYRLTGRSHEKEVIAYQIRQSFKPGEITPEEANRVGYETAMRFTKGKDAFTVSTHTDRAHIHNHIIFNSTTLDCTHKFRNFLKSGHAQTKMVTDLYAHILDDDRRINAQRFEEAFYSGRNGNEVASSAAAEAVQAVEKGAIDPAQLAKILSDPTMAALIKSLAANIK